MSIRSVVKSLSGSLEDVLSITGVVSDGIGITKSYISEIRQEQELGKEVRMIKFRDELNVDLAESKVESKAKLANLAMEYEVINTPETNQKIEKMLRDMVKDFKDYTEED